MKKLLTVMFVALLLAGCGEEAQKKAVQEEAKDDPSVPLLIPCEACGKEVSKKTEKCLGCGHPAPDSVVAYKEARRLAEIKAEEIRKAKPFGGLEVLAKIKEARKSGATLLDLDDNQISDLSPLKGLTNLEELYLHENQITDAQKAMLIKALPDCDISF
jgi:Leucine-rich repeat (LRR) protein